MKVPAPPIASFENARQSTPAKASRRVKLSAPLDAGFLNRTHITSLWVGALAVMIAYGQTRSLKFTLSLIGGIALGALLLKSQEIFVRRVMSPVAVKGAGKFARFPLMILLGLKFGVVMALMGISMEAGWLQPIAFVVGFFTQQLVVVAKVAGRFLSLKTRAAGEESSADSLNIDPNLKHGA